MKTILITLTILVSFNCVAQNKTNRFLIGVAFSPEISYRTLENTDGSSTSSWIIDIRNNLEKPKFGYTTGFSCVFNPTPKWGFESGLYYANKGYQYRIKDIVIGESFDPTTGTFQPSLQNINKIDFTENFHYLDIPLRTIMTLGNGRFRFLSSIGVTTHFLLGSTVTSKIDYSDRETKTSRDKNNFDFNKVNLSATASVGLMWQVSDQVNMRVEPTFRYGLLNIIDAPITAHLWSGGINVTCYYAIK